MNQNKFSAQIGLVFTTLAWGATFVLVKNALNDVVNNINDIPEIEDNQTLVNDVFDNDQYDTYTYQINVSDSDGNEELDFSLSQQPNNMSIDNTGIITWTNIPEDTYYEEFVIVVTDGIVTLYQNNLAKLFVAIGLPHISL